mmetsp:Transcript_23953/g.34333  ORF Transcript_23953/g.34333 Transcript_23953/m.34333 type:complete len:96 (-) Transcript_23953:79-366(-)
MDKAMTLVLNIEQVFTTTRKSKKKPPRKNLKKKKKTIESLLRRNASQLNCFGRLRSIINNTWKKVADSAWHNLLKRDVPTKYVVTVKITKMDANY